MLSKWITTNITKQSAREVGQIHRDDPELLPGDLSGRILDL
jgi:hypothetical protein